MGSELKFNAMWKRSDWERFDVRVTFPVTISTTSFKER